MCVYACVCKCKKERQRERGERHTHKEKGDRQTCTHRDMHMSIERYKHRDPEREIGEADSRV